MKMRHFTLPDTVRRKLVRRKQGTERKRLIITSGIMLQLKSNKLVDSDLISKLLRFGTLGCTGFDSLIIFKHHLLMSPTAHYTADHTI